MMDVNVVETRQVVRGEVWSGLRIIRSGLSAEDNVVISGLQRVRPGAQVSPVLEQIKLPAALCSPYDRHYNGNFIYTPTKDRK